MKLPWAKPKISWYEPRWAYTRRLWSQMKSVWALGPLLRITLGTAVASALIIFGLRWAFPQMVLPNLWPLAFALPAIILTLALQLGILTLIPPTVTVRADKIVIQHGQSATIIDAKSVTATYLIFHANDRIRLRICYTTKSKARSRIVGVGPSVDLNRLTEMLPVFPVVRDARQRGVQVDSQAGSAEDIGLG